MDAYELTSVANVALADDDGDHAALDVVPVNYCLRVLATKYNMSNCARGSSLTANHSLHPESKFTALLLCAGDVVLRRTLAAANNCSSVLVAYRTVLHR